MPLPAEPGAPPDRGHEAAQARGDDALWPLFITTGTFSSEAAHVTTIDPKVVLIDGEQLAEIMIAFNVGISPMASYEIKRIDSDYFVEE